MDQCGATSHARDIPKSRASSWQESWNVMSTSSPDQSTRSVLWWARNFGRPLQAEFVAGESDTPEDFNQLLEMADQRIQESRGHSNAE